MHMHTKIADYDGSNYDGRTKDGTHTHKFTVTTNDDGTTGVFFARSDPSPDGVFRNEKERSSEVCAHQSTHTRITPPMRVRVPTPALKRALLLRNSVPLPERLREANVFLDGTRFD
jgi:hypothetical protein